MVYTATLGPYRTAFIDDEDISASLRALEVIVDTMFIADIFITFVTPYKKDYSEHYEYRLKKISENYLLGGFVIDLIASFPFNLFKTKGSDEATTNLNELLRLARLQRIYRLLRLFRIMRLLKFQKYDVFKL